MDVVAPEGFGLGVVIVDLGHPSDPVGTQLDLLINEPSCADGEAPIGWQVRPGD